MYCTSGHGIYSMTAFKRVRTFFYKKFVTDFISEENYKTMALINMIRENKKNGELRKLKILMCFSVFYCASINSPSYSGIFEETELVQGMRVGFYWGSFDPFHKGHEDIVRRSLKGGRSDYVVVFPEPGDSFPKPQRSSWEIRNEMLLNLYSKHPQVLIAKTPDPEFVFQKLFSAKCFIIGLIGSDAAIPIARGIASVPKKPNLWFMFNRSEEESQITRSPNFKTLIGQPVIQFRDRLELSSTEIKNSIKYGTPLEDLPINPKIIPLIKKHRLYGVDSQKIVSATRRYLKIIDLLCRVNQFPSYSHLRGEAIIALWESVFSNFPDEYVTLQGHKSSIPLFQAFLIQEIYKRYPLVMTYPLNEFSQDRTYVTLCFKSRELSDHASLVFEYNKNGELHSNFFDLATPNLHCPKIFRVREYGGEKVIPSFIWSQNHTHHEMTYYPYKSFCLETSRATPIIKYLREQGEIENYPYSTSGKERHNCHTFIADILLRLGIIQSLSSPFTYPDAEWVKELADQAPGEKLPNGIWYSKGRDYSISIPFTQSRLIEVLLRHFKSNEKPPMSKL